MFLDGRAMRYQNTEASYRGVEKESATLVLQLSQALEAHPLAFFTLQDSDDHIQRKHKLHETSNNINLM